MFKQNTESEEAVVIIPEIYGINQYIRDWEDFFKDQGYEPFCVDLSGRNHVYGYSESNEAYHDFTTDIGFDRFKQIEIYINELKSYYKKIFVFGSSVGATIAWRLTESGCCDGMIGYYGSRIRDYLEVNPVCPCLLVFSGQEKSFELQSIIPQLEQKDKVEILVLPAKHGFADPHGKDFHEQSGKKALDMVKCFLRELEKSDKI
jgi:dienelactone hydrolase